VQSSSAEQRRALAGVLLALMLFFSLVAGLHPEVESYKDIWPSGLLAGFAAILLVPDTSVTQRIQLGVLISIGVALLFYSLSKGAVLQWSSVLSQNTGLLAMLFSVGLLKLITTASKAAEQKLPIGPKAFLHTIVSVTSLGSIINISAPVVIADRLSLNRPLDYFSAGTVVRAFSACAAWSPFFAGMAVVLTAVGDEHLPSIMAYGLPLTVMFVIVLYTSGIVFTPDKVDAFRGYPIEVESFFVPVSLAAMVFIANWVFPDVLILSLISLSSIVLTAIILSSRLGLSVTVKRLGEYVTVDLPRMISELQLFISAGILASGLQVLVQAGSLSAPIDHFNGGTACALLGAILVIAGMGIHPVIIIASITPILSAVNPDPVLLGLTYIFGWSLGTCVSPLSGTNLVMQGRFGVVAWRIALQNWPYCVVLYGIACSILIVRSQFG